MQAPAPHHRAVCVTSGVSLSTILAADSYPRPWLPWGTNVVYGGNMWLYLKVLPLTCETLAERRAESLEFGHSARWKAPRLPAVQSQRLWGQTMARYFHHREISGIYQHVGMNCWCGREDSNLHGLSATATSTLRVYQFRHDRTPMSQERGSRLVSARPSSTCAAVQAGIRQLS